MSYNLSSLDKVQSLVERLRFIRPRMELQTAMTLLIIARKRRMTKPELENLLGMNGASSYRNIGLLKDEKLIAVAPHVKGSVLTLTAHGERFIRSLTDIIEA